MPVIATPEANRVLDDSLAGCEVALCTADPGTSGTISNEVTAASYGRQAVTFAPASGRAASPTADVEFSVAAEPWGTLTHAAIVHVATGNVRWSGPLTAPKTIEASDSFAIPAADLDVTLDA